MLKSNYFARQLFEWKWFHLFTELWRNLVDQLPNYLIEWQLFNCQHQCNINNRNEFWVNWAISAWQNTIVCSLFTTSFSSLVPTSRRDKMKYILCFSSNLTAFTCPMKVSKSILFRFWGNKLHYKHSNLYNLELPDIEINFDCLKIIC